MPKKKTLSQRLFALFTLTVFLFSNHFGQNTFLFAAEAIPQAASIEFKQFPSDGSLVRMPAQMGKIEDSFRGRNNETVVIIQDAHSIPDAQKNIQKIIGFFQKQYGVNLVGLEGASSQLDPQIFKSFPDKKLLRQIFSQYLNQGELTAGTGAAIFSESAAGETVFHGVEDWDLYEQGVGLFLAAMQREAELTPKLQAWEASLQTRKEKSYSAKLRALDKTLESFRKNETDLVATLKALAAVKGPERGSELSAFMEELNREKMDGTAVELEVNRVARLVGKYLAAKKPSLETQKDMKAYQDKLQDFRVSNLSAQAFALFLKELIAKDHLQIKVSEDLLGGIENQKKMRDIEGTKFFRDLEVYAAAVKESLMENDGQRALNKETQEFGIVEKLTKLELSREEWARVSGGLILKTSEFISEDDLKLHKAFYENAEKRDAAFLKNLDAGWRDAGHHSALLIAGGFHAQGLTRRLKEKNISYMLVMPEIKSIPKEIHYQEQMRDEVSWKNYFKAENGKIDLYKAFVRGTRDRLLQTDETHQMLKNWRDQIIRDLAEKQQIQRAGEYTRFLDEALGDQKNTLDARLSAAFEKVDRFVAGLRGLKEKNELTEINIMNLVKPGAAIPRAPGAALAPKSFGTVETFLTRAAVEAVSAQKAGQRVLGGSRAENRPEDRKKSQGITGEAPSEARPDITQAYSGVIRSRGLDWKDIASGIAQRQSEAAIPGTMLPSEEKRRRWSVYLYQGRIYEPGGPLTIEFESLPENAEIDPEKQPLPGQIYRAHEGSDILTAWRIIDFRKNPPSKIFVYPENVEEVKQALAALGLPDIEVRSNKGLKADSKKYYHSVRADSGNVERWKSLLKEGAIMAPLERDYRYDLLQAKLGNIQALTPQAFLEQFLILDRQMLEADQRFRSESRGAAAEPERRPGETPDSYRHDLGLTISGWDDNSRNDDDRLRNVALRELTGEKFNVSAREIKDTRGGFDSVYEIKIEEDGRSIYEKKGSGRDFTDAGIFKFLEDLNALLSPQWRAIKNQVRLTNAGLKGLRRLIRALLALTIFAYSMLFFVPNMGLPLRLAVITIFVETMTIFIAALAGVFMFNQISGLFFFRAQKAGRIIRNFQSTANRTAQPSEDLQTLRSENREEELTAAEAGLAQARELAAAGDIPAAEAKLLSIFDDSADQYGRRKSFTGAGGNDIKAEIEDLFHMVELTIADGRGNLEDKNTFRLSSTSYFNIITFNPAILPFFRTHHQELMGLGKFIGDYIYAMQEMQDFDSSHRIGPPPLTMETSYLANPEFLVLTLKLTSKIKDTSTAEAGIPRTNGAFRKFIGLAGSLRSTGADSADKDALDFLMTNQAVLLELDSAVLVQYLEALGRYAGDYLLVDSSKEASLNRRKPETEHIRIYKNPLADLRVMRRALEISRNSQNKAQEASRYFQLMSQHTQLVRKELLQKVFDFLKDREGLEITLMPSQEKEFFEALLNASGMGPALMKRDFDSLLGHPLEQSAAEALGALIKAIIPSLKIETAVDVFEEPDNQARWQQLSEDQKISIADYFAEEKRQAAHTLADFKFLLTPKIFELYRKHGTAIFPLLDFLRNAPEKETDWMLGNGDRFFDLTARLPSNEGLAYGDALLEASPEDRELLKSREFLEKIASLSEEARRSPQQNKPFERLFSFVHAQNHPAYLPMRQIFFGSTASDFFAMQPAVWSELHRKRQNASAQDLAFWSHPAVTSVLAVLTGGSEFEAFVNRLKTEEFKDLILSNAAARNALIASLKGPVRDSQAIYLKSVSPAALLNAESGNLQGRLQSDVSDPDFRSQLLETASRNTRFQEYLSADDYAGLRFLNDLAAKRGIDMAMGYVSIASTVSDAGHYRAIQDQYQAEFFDSENPQTFLLAILTIAADQPSVVGKIDLAHQRRNHDAWESLFDTYARAAGQDPSILGDSAFEQEIQEILNIPPLPDEKKPSRSFTGYAQRSRGGVYLVLKDESQRKANRWQIAQSVVRLRERRPALYAQYLRQKEALRNIHPDLLERITYFPENMALHPDFLKNLSRFDNPELFNLIVDVTWRGSRTYAELALYDAGKVMKVLERFGSGAIGSERIAALDKWMRNNPGGEPDERLASLVALIDLEVPPSTLQDLMALKQPHSFYARLGSEGFQNFLRRLKEGFGSAVVEAVIRVVARQGSRTNFDAYESEGFYDNLAGNVDALYGTGGRQVFGAVVSEAAFGLLGLPSEELSKFVETVQGWAGADAFHAELTAGNFIVLQQWYSLYQRLRSEGLEAVFNEHISRAPPELNRKEYLIVLSSLHDDLLFHLLKLPSETSAAWQNNLAVLQELNRTHSSFKGFYYQGKNRVPSLTLKGFSNQLTQRAKLLNFRTPELSALNDSEFLAFQFESLEKALDFSKALASLPLNADQAGEVEMLKEEIRIQLLTRKFFQRVLDTGRRSLVPEMRSFGEQLDKHPEVIRPGILNRFLERVLGQSDKKLKESIKFFHYAGDLLQIRSAIKSKLEDAASAAETEEGSSLAATRKFLGKNALDILDDDEMTAKTAQEAHRSAIMKLFTNLTGLSKIPDETLSLLVKDPSLFSKILTAVSLYYSLENHMHGGSHADREKMRTQISALLREFVLTRDHAKLRDSILKLAANVKEKALLIDAGYDERLFTHGFQMDIELKAVSETERRETAKAAIRQASQELIELAVQSGFRPRAMTEMAEGDFSAVRFDNLADAQAFVSEMSGKPGMPAAVQERLGQILASIRNLEEEAQKKAQASAAEKVRIVMSKDVIDEMTSCTNVPGCFSPQGFHREMPVVHSMEANAFMVRIYGITETGEQGPMIANLVAGLTDQGIVIWAVYSNRPELNLQKGETLLQFWKSLAQWAPSVILAEKSAGWDAAVKGNLPMTENLEAVKRGTLWGPMYYDGSGESLLDGSQKLKFAKAIVIKKEQFPDAPAPVPNAPAPAAAPETPAQPEETAEASSRTQEIAEAPAAARAELTKDEKKEIQRNLFGLGLNINLNPVLAQLNEIVLNSAFDLDSILDTLKSRTQRNQPADMAEIQTLKDKLLELQRFYLMPEFISEGFNRFLEQIEGRREELMRLRPQLRQTEMMKMLKTIITEDLKVNLHPETEMPDNSALSARLSQRGAAAVEGDATRLFAEGLARAQQLIAENAQESPGLEEELLGGYQPTADQAVMTGALLMESGNMRIQLQEPGSDLYLNEASFRQQTDISRMLQFELYVKNGQVRLEIVDLVALDNAPNAARFYLMFGQLVQTLANRLGQPVIVENETAVFGGEESGLGMTQVKKPQSQIKNLWIKKVQPLGLTSEDFSTQGIDQENFRYYEAVFKPQTRNESRGGVDEAAFAKFEANADKDAVDQLRPFWEAIVSKISAGEERFSDAQLLRLFDLIRTRRVFANLYAPGASPSSDFIESMTKISPALRAGRTPEEFTQVLSLWAKQKLEEVSASGISMLLPEKRISREEFTDKNPGIAPFFFDTAKAKVFYEILSVLRMLTNFKTHQINPNTRQVEKVADRSLPVEIAPNVFVRSGTGSFRRHVIYETDVAGTLRGAYEIKMPGDWVGKTEVSRQDFTVARDLAAKSQALRDRVQQGVFIAEFPTPVNIQLYGRENESANVWIVISDEIRAVHGRLEDYAGLGIPMQQWRRLAAGGEIKTLIPQDQLESVLDQIAFILKSIFDAGYLGDLDLIHLQNFVVEEREGGKLFVSLPNDFSDFKTMQESRKALGEDLFGNGIADPSAGDAAIIASIQRSGNSIKGYLIQAFPGQAAMIESKFKVFDPHDPAFGFKDFLRAENRIGDDSRRVQPVQPVMRTLLTERRVAQTPQQQAAQSERNPAPATAPQAEVGWGPSIRFQQFAVSNGLVPAEGKYVQGYLRTESPRGLTSVTGREAYEALNAGRNRFLADLNAVEDHSLDYVITPFINEFTSPSSNQTILELIRQKLKVSGDVRLIVYDDTDVNRIEGGLSALDEHFNIAYEYDNGDPLPRFEDAGYFIYLVRSEDRNIQRTVPPRSELFNAVGGAIAENRPMTRNEAREVKKTYLEMDDDAFLQGLREGVENHYVRKAADASENDRYLYEAMKQQELILIDAMKTVPSRSNQKVTVALAGKQIPASFESIFFSVAAAAGDVGTVVPAGVSVASSFIKQAKQQGMQLRPTASPLKPVKADGQSEIPMYLIARDLSIKVNSAFMPVTLKMSGRMSDTERVMAEEHAQRLAVMTMILSARFFGDPAVKTQADLLEKLNEIPVFRNLFTSENDALVLDADAAWLTILQTAQKAKQAAARAA